MSRGARILSSVHQFSASHNNPLRHKEIKALGVKTQVIDQSTSLGVNAMFFHRAHAIVGCNHFGYQVFEGLVGCRLSLLGHDRL